VLSSAPNSFNASARRPTCASLCSAYPAYVSINRHALLVGRQRVVSGDSVRSRREACIRRNDAQLFLPRERQLALPVPTVVEFAAILSIYSFGM
jgi:hypothetical protein